MKFARILFVLALVLLLLGMENAVDAKASKSSKKKNKKSKNGVGTMEEALDDMGAKVSPEEAQGRFGFLLDALKYGAPPHGGIALGIDRVVMLFGGLENIRDCIAFPKTQRAMDLMTEAPNTVAKEQLKELGLNLAQPPAQNPAKN